MKPLLLTVVVVIAIQFAAVSQQQQPATDPSTNRVDETTATAKDTGRDGHFIAYDNGTVLDTKTKLMWAAKDNGSALSWPDAKSYCETYRGGGYTDWRLPTLDELAGLYDPAKTYKPDSGGNSLDQATLDGLKKTLSEKEYKALTDTDVHLTELIHLACTRLWTSQARSQYPGSVLMFDFHYGHETLRPGYQNFVDTAGRVLPVRSGTPAMAATPKP